MAAEEHLEVVARNIGALLEARARFEKKRSRQHRLADTITRFAGSMASVYVHGVVYGGWIVVNTGAVGVRPWDPFPFLMLAVAASIEAIFLSTFVLVSQNRMAALADRRADLDLQINLLSEHEVTKLLDLSMAIAAKLGVEMPHRAELHALTRDVAPETVLDQIESASRGGAPHPEKGASPGGALEDVVTPPRRRPAT